MVFNFFWNKSLLLLPPPSALALARNLAAMTLADKTASVLIVPWTMLAFYIAWNVGTRLYSSEWVGALGASMFGVDSVQYIDLVRYAFGWITGNLVFVIVLKVYFFLAERVRAAAVSLSEISEIEIQMVLTLSDTFSEVEAYRRAVYSQGRKLVIGELQAMKKWASKHGGKRKIKSLSVAP